MPRKKSKTGKPKVHKDLEGFEININEFGEIVTNRDVADLNKFLNKHVTDLKFEGRKDIDESWLSVDPEPEKEETIDDLMREVDDKELKKVKSKKLKKKK